MERKCGILKHSERRDKRNNRNVGSDSRPSILFLSFKSHVWWLSPRYQHYLETGRWRWWLQKDKWGQRPYGPAVAPMPDRQQAHTLDMWMTDGDSVGTDKWGGSAVNSSLEDSAVNVLLEKCKHKVSFDLRVRHLTLCPLSCLFATVALVWDYTLPFADCKPVWAQGIVSWLVRMGIQTLSPSCKESIFLVAHWKTLQEWTRG